MNMISTGAFLPEMDASNKQETVAEKFARVWEKKNAKAARAGGVSLMALSLAACGSDSDPVVETDTTPFDQSDIDAAVDAALAEAALNNPTVTDFAVSAAGDRIEGTDGADTVTFTNAQFDAQDQLIDDSTGDGDVVNVTLTAAGAAAAISGFEQINVTLDVLAGVAFDATNVTGATIDVSGTRLGYDGVAQVTAAGANDVTTSGDVTTLTVTDLSTGTVDASGLTTLTIDAADFTATATSRTQAVTIDGDIALNATIDANAATDDYTLNITATDTATVTLDLTNAATAIGDDGSITINNTGDITLAFDADELEVGAGGTDIAVAGTTVSVNGGKADITANTGGSLGLGGFDVDEVQVSVATALNLTAVNGQTIVVDVEDATLNIDGAAATDAVTINVLDDQDGAGSAIDALTSLGTVNLNIGADDGTNRVDTLLAVSVDGDLNLSMAQDLTITTLTNTTTADTITVSGTGDLTITNAVLMGTGALDASALVGGVTANNTDANGEFVGGSDTDTITMANIATTFEASLGAGDDTVDAAVLTTGTLIVDGGAGDDTATVDALTSGTLVASMGAGDDTITLSNNIIAAASITVDGGDGEDTLDLDGADLTLANTSVAISNIEIIDIDAGSALFASDITGMTVSITGDGGANRNLTIDDDSTTGNMTLDISGLTFDTTMAGGADGTAIAVAGADQITLSAGDDELTITGVVGAYTDVDSSGTINDGDTFEGNFAVITDYNQGTVAAGAITAAADTGHANIAAAADEVAVDGTWNATTQTFTADDDGADCLVYSATLGECAVFVGVTDLII